MKKILALITATIWLAAAPQAIAQKDNITINSIRIAGPFDVKLVQGDTDQVLFDNDTDSALVKITRQGNLLSVETHPKGKKTGTINLTIHYTSLRSVDLAGSGSVSGQSVIKGDKLDVHVAGSGRMQMDVGVSVLNTALAGSGDITLTGQAAEHNITLSGSGKVEASRLHVTDCKATLSGSGDVSVNVKGRLDGTITGSGNIRYSGKPENKNVNVTGSGKMTPM